MKTKRKKIGKYVQVYGWHLDKFLGRNWNIKLNPHYRPKQKYSYRYVWWYRNFEFEEIYKGIAGKEPLWPQIDTVPCEGYMMWLMNNMVKYGLVVQKDKDGIFDGYEVTDQGKAVHQEWCQYMVDIGANKVNPYATV